MNKLSISLCAVVGVALVGCGNNQSEPKTDIAAVPPMDASTGTAGQVITPEPVPVPAPAPAPAPQAAPAPVQPQVQPPAQPRVEAPAQPTVTTVTTAARNLIRAAPKQASEARIQANFTPAYNSCLDRAGSTAAMSACMNDELKTQDDRLNRAYVQVMRRLPDAENAQLRQVQRNWIRTRDQRCSAAGATGGSIDALNRMTCHVEMTISRTLELEEIGSKI